MNPQDDINLILNKAAWSNQTEKLIVSAACKVTQSTKDKADFICHRNGTTLSNFLRECMESLCASYDPKHESGESK